MMGENFYIDLRSDTVTKPSPSMRQAMAEAKVGDDVYGEDPTVNRLEQLAAELLGKESAMFVPSGTMGNLICLLTHCGRGEEVIIGDQAHMFLYERGGSAVLGGIHPYTVTNAIDGSLPLSEIRAAVRPDDIHCPTTKLLCVENTQAQRGGIPLSLNYLHGLSDLAKELGLALHCDGARLWNASVATGVEPSVLSSPFDSLSVCLSKGLAAPIGSLVIGTQSFVDQARRLRKLLGGGMRQVGAIASAGLIALEQMRDRLAIDHENAQFLAEGLRSCGYEVLHSVQTNIIFFRQHEQDILSISERLAVWKNSGLLVSDFGDQIIRAVTHYGIEREDIDQVISILQKL